MRSFLQFVGHLNSLIESIPYSISSLVWFPAPSVWAGRQRGGGGRVWWITWFQHGSTEFHSCRILFTTHTYSFFPHWHWRLECSIELFTRPFLLLPFLALPIQEGSGKQSISILVADFLVPRPHLARILLPAICAGAGFGSGLETRLQTLLQKTYKWLLSFHQMSRPATKVSGPSWELNLDLLNY